MSKRYTAIIIKEGPWYIARCLELDVTSQGRNIQDAQANLKEAIELYLESFGEDDLPASAEEVLIYPVEVPLSA